VSNPDTLDITPSPELSSAPIYRHWAHPSIKCAHDAHDKAIGASHGHRRKSHMTQQFPLCTIISEDA
jgi:hypothetical protein